MYVQRDGISDIEDMKQLSTDEKTKTEQHMEAEAISPLSPAQSGVLGEVLWLMGHSRLYRKYSVDDIHRLVIPPILTNQAILFRKAGKPHAYVSWAFLSSEVADGFSQDTYRLTAQDWCSGNELWMMDFLAPFGGGIRVAGHLRKHFAGRTAYSLRFDENRKLVGKVHWHAQKWALKQGK